MSDFGKTVFHNTPDEGFPSEKITKKVGAAAGADGVFLAIPAKVGVTTIVRARVIGYDATAGETAYYDIEAIGQNKAGTTALLGAVTAHRTIEEDATWACTIAANNTDDTLDLTLTVDDTNATVWWIEAEVRRAPVAITA